MEHAVPWRWNCLLWSTWHQSAIFHWFQLQPWPQSVAYQPWRFGTGGSILRTKLWSCADAECISWKSARSGRRTISDFWKRCAGSIKRQSDEGIWNYYCAEWTGRQTWHRDYWYRRKPCSWHEIPRCIRNTGRYYPDGSAQTAGRTDYRPWYLCVQKNGSNQILRRCVRRQMVHSAAWSVAGIYHFHWRKYDRWSENETVQRQHY